MRKTLVRLLLGIFLLVFAAGCRQQEVSPELIVHNADELVSSSVETSQGGSFVLLFYSSLSWEASVSPVNASWLSISSASGNAGENSIVLATTINASAEPRSADIVLSCGNVFKSVTVRQEGLPEEDFFEVSPETLEVPYTGGTVSVDIRTNLEYEIEILDEWITLLTTEMVQDGAIEFEVAANPLNESRRGTIRIMAEGHSPVTISVVQEAAPEEEYFEVSPASISVSAAGGDIAVNISTNMDYTVEVTVPEWIAMVSGAGVKEGELIFRVSENQSTEDRTGIILFSTDESDYEVTVLQAGKEPDDDPSGGNEGVGNDDEHNW